MFAVKYYYRTSFITWAGDSESTGIVWTPRFETVENALLYAQEMIQRYGYDRDHLRVVKVNE